MCGKTITALQHFANFSECVYDTKLFVEIILKFWKIVNVKSPFKRRNLRDTDCDPIRSVNDYIDKLVTWLDVWGEIKLKARQGGLSQ